MKKIKKSDKSILTIEPSFQIEEINKRDAELIIANKELAFQNKEKDKRAAELVIANIELAFQNKEKEKRAVELNIANIELAFQNKEKEKDKRAAELVIANIELAFQNDEKGKRAVELNIANIELAFQNNEKDKRSAELAIANIELAYQNKEKDNRASELAIANVELAYQNKEKDKRSAELAIANIELAYQNEEKEKRAIEVVIAHNELAFQNKEKDKRSAELTLANIELAFQNEEKEKREAELINVHNELKKAAEQFRLVVESAPSALVLINKKGLIILVNNQTKKFFGYHRNDLIGKNLDILIPKRFHYKFFGSKNSFFKKNDTGVIDSDEGFFAIGKNRIEIEVEIDLNPIETVEGHMVLASFIDLTERKFQEETQKKKMELEIKNNNLEQFAYLASHDLQEPLRNISGLIELFERDYVKYLDSSAKEYLKAVNNSTKRMSMLIKSLLEFSLLGRNTELKFVDFNILIDEVTVDLYTLIKNFNVSIEVSEMPNLNVYEFQIRQIFQNLITNAIKFRRNDISLVIKISSQKIGKLWKFSVSDNGIGIDPTHFQKVFNIFQRLHNYKDYEGSGIGLANCKKIVEMHQGEIWIESILGQGSTFHFTIANLDLN